MGKGAQGETDAIKMPASSVLDRWEFKCGMCSISYVLPFAALAHLCAVRGGPTFSASMMTVLGAIVDISFCMSVLLHRYFSHRAFHTGKRTQMAFAWLSCLAYQMGPLWWVTKHRRHHKHCDTPEDPHSWVQMGWLRAWVGWTLDPKEQGLDREFLGSLANSPELMTVERLWFLPPAALVGGLHMGLGVHPTYPLFAMLLCRLITLMFNCEYHPPSQEGKCKSVNVVRFLSEIVGESHHDDHHVFPNRAKRPGIDLAFHMFISPLILTGLAWMPPKA